MHLCVHNTKRPNSTHPITVASPMQTIMSVMNRCLHMFRVKLACTANGTCNGVWPHSTHTFRGMLHQLSPATTSILYMNTAPTHGMVSHMHTYTTLHPSHSHTHIIMYTYSINTCMTVYECTHTHSIPGLPSCQFCQSPTVDIPTVNKGQAALPPCRGHSTTHVHCWAHCQPPSPH